MTLFILFFYICHDGSDASLFSFSQAIFPSPANVVSEAYATSPGLNQVSESYYRSLKHQANQSPSILTSDLDSQSKALANSLMGTPVNGNMPSDVPARQNSLGLWKYLDDDITCLGDKPSSAIPTTRPVSDEMPFHIIEISSEWAYCTEDTKVTPLPSSSNTEFPCFLVLFPSSAAQFLLNFFYFTVMCYDPLKSLFILTIYQYHVSPGWWTRGGGGVCNLLIKCLREHFACMPV
jgi:hypothetical protein